MKEYELLEMQAKAMRMVEGTNVDWERCVRFKDCSGLWHVTSGMKTTIDYQLALAIVEGKPVFPGDEIWCLGATNGWFKTTMTKALISENLSRNPPKPKTVTIELSREDAEQIAGIAYLPDTLWFRIAKSFKEALK